MPPPSPFGEGDKCLPDLGTQSQLLHPTVLGLDGNLSVGTVLSKGAGLRGGKTALQHESPTCHPFTEELDPSTRPQEAQGGPGSLSIPHLQGTTRSPRLRLELFSDNFY